MYIEQFFIDGLGCASYLVGCEAQGVAAVVDPDRDVEKYLSAAEKRGLTISHIIETHLHADHVSGGADLAARTGADIYLHPAAQAGFAHQPISGGDVLTLGGVRIEVVHTPGHTPESITLLVSDVNRSTEPWMALTGDLLFVGDVGRPDLVGAEAAKQLAGDLYESLFHGVLQQADHLIIYPGHGAGSLCGRSMGSVRSSSLGYERRFNPALQIEDKGRFVDYMTANLPEQPGNHRNIKAMNRRGPRPLGQVQPRPLSVDEAIPSFRAGAAMLDLRSKAAFVAQHVPGAVHIEAPDLSTGGSSLSGKIGFVLPPEVPIVLVLDDPADYRAAVMALARVGFENVAGYLKDGLTEWVAMGLPVTSGDIVDLSAPELFDLLLNGNGSKPVVVDVREPWEYAMGHIADARLIPLGQLAQRLNELDPHKPVAVVCQSGSRSQSAAALLGQKGFSKVYNLQYGMSGWQMAGLEMDR
jgi:glyoxylase-like metal-dependent hydrolase (beta-lactamase superfamily II)/rhodanese-related sulfurtransferase